MFTFLVQLLVTLLIVALLLYVLKLVWPADPRIINIIGAVLVVLVLLYFFGLGPRRWP